MSIQAQCRCGNAWQVDDDLAGRQLLCPACEERVVCPGCSERQDTPAPPPALPKKSHKWLWLAVGLVAVLCGAGLAVRLLMPDVGKVREAANRDGASGRDQQLQKLVPPVKFDSRRDTLPYASNPWALVGGGPAGGNLERIVGAIDKYHATHGRLPANITNADGKPLLSWRVRLLPFLEQEGLYKQFRLDEPWDGPSNRPLVKKMPPVYALAIPRPGGVTDGTSNTILVGEAPSSKEGLTFFQGFAGPGTVFEPEKKLRLADVTDGPADTIFVAEAAEAVPWARPADLAYDPKGPLPRLRNQPGGSSLVVTGDGKARLLPAGISEATLRAAITRNGGEKLGPDWPGPLPAPSWGAPSPWGGTSMFHLLPYVEQKGLSADPGWQGWQGKYAYPLDLKDSKGPPGR